MLIPIVSNSLNYNWTIATNPITLKVSIGCPSINPITIEKVKTADQQPNFVNFSPLLLELKVKDKETPEVSTVSLETYLQFSTSVPYCGVYKFEVFNDSSHTLPLPLSSRT